MDGMTEAQAAYRSGENPDDPVAIARGRMLDKRMLERQKAEEDAEAHRIAEQIRADEKGAELDLLLEEAAKLNKALPAQIRMLAFHMGVNANLYGAGRKLQLDERALEIARYALNGDV